jgi:predicted DsbA family dithiol-disulfide isomerase
MIERRNIARRDVILAVADELASGQPDSLDADRLRHDLEDRAALNALREDIKELRYLEIGRFPALTLRRPGGAGVIIVGYRSYDALLAALARVAPDLEPVRRALSRTEYETYWGRCTARELDEALGELESGTEAAALSRDRGARD